MTDWGGPMRIDIALYAMGVSCTKSVMASGGEICPIADDASETPDKATDGLRIRRLFNMLWEHATGIDGATMASYRGIAYRKIMPLWSSIVVAGKSFLRAEIKMASPEPIK